MIKRVLIALALVGAMAACNTPAATTSPSAPALDTAPPRRARRHPGHGEPGA